MCLKKKNYTINRLAHRDADYYYILFLVMTDDGSGGGGTLASCIISSQIITRQHDISPANGNDLKITHYRCCRTRTRQSVAGHSPFPLNFVGSHFVHGSGAAFWLRLLCVIICSAIKRKTYRRRLFLSANCGTSQCSFYSCKFHSVSLFRFLFPLAVRTEWERA